MKFEFAKFKKLSIIKVLLMAIFLLLAIYQAYFLYGVYSNLNSQQPDDVHVQGVVKFDWNGFQNASNRYTSNLKYAPPAENIPDPFSVSVPGVNTP